MPDERWLLCRPACLPTNLHLRGLDLSSLDITLSLECYRQTPAGIDVLEHLEQRATTAAHVLGLGPWPLTTTLIPPEMHWSTLYAECTKPAEPACHCGANYIARGNRSTLAASHDIETALLCSLDRALVWTTRGARNCKFGSTTHRQWLELRIVGLSDCPLLHSTPQAFEFPGQFQSNSSSLPLRTTAPPRLACAASMGVGIAF